MTASLPPVDWLNLPKVYANAFRCDKPVTLDQELSTQSSELQEKGHCTADDIRNDPLTFENRKTVKIRERIGSICMCDCGSEGPMLSMSAVVGWDRRSAGCVHRQATA